MVVYSSRKITYNIREVYTVLCKARSDMRLRLEYYKNSPLWKI
jgi:hypothetical protein